MDIMKIYGQKLSLPKKKQQTENNYLSPREGNVNDENARRLDRSIIKEK